MSNAPQKVQQNGSNPPCSVGSFQFGGRVGRSLGRFRGLGRESVPFRSTTPRISFSSAAASAPSFARHMGAVDKQIKPPTTDSEASPGSTYFLAQRLNEQDTGGADADDTEAFPDEVARIPVPNEVLDSLGGLSGCAVRLAVCLMREAYHWTGTDWKCSPRLRTRSEIDALGMSAQSVRNAADDLAERGWIERRTRGQSHAYRWRLSAPRSRFTFLPLALFYEHERLSHSGLTLLLALYRATWGWTSNEDGQTVHDAWALLSTSDLESMTGLCASTLRAAASKVIHNGGAKRERSRPGGAFLWRPDPSFFNYHHTKFTGGTSRERKSNQQTRTGARKAEASSSRGSVAGRGKDEGSKRKPRALSDTEQRWADWLMSPPFGMHYHQAAKLAASRSLDLLQKTRGLWEEERERVENPGGWMWAALTESWAGKLDNKTADVQTSDSDSPVSDALHGMKQGSQKSTGGVVPPRERLGMTYDEMTSAVHEVRGLVSDHFVMIEHQDDRPTWVPNLKTARWAWKHSGEMLPSANKWLNRMVQVRKEYESTDSA